MVIFFFFFLIGFSLGFLGCFSWGFLRFLHFSLVIFLALGLTKKTSKFFSCFFSRLLKQIQGIYGAWSKLLCLSQC